MSRGRFQWGVCTTWPQSSATDSVGDWGSTLRNATQEMIKVSQMDQQTWIFKICLECLPFGSFFLGEKAPISTYLEDPGIPNIQRICVQNLVCVSMSTQKIMTFPLTSVALYKDQSSCNGNQYKNNHLRNWFSSWAPPLLVQLFKLM